MPATSANSLTCDVAVIGAGLGGCAAAQALIERGLNVVVAHDGWIVGGQLTAQGVPPDEHPWIERTGCTRRYRMLRDLVRGLHGAKGSLEPAHEMNPGGGWVSRLCAEPADWLQAIRTLCHLEQATVLLGTRVLEAKMSGRRIESLLLQGSSGERTELRASFFLDATETGELMPLTETPYRIGSESREETGEPHAPETADPLDVQGFTWCFAMAFDPTGDFVGEPPPDYEFWRSYQPPHWPDKLLSWWVPDPATLKPRKWQLFGDSEGPGLFEYRQFAHPERGALHGAAITCVNWPQNDYFLDSILDASPEEVSEHLRRSRELSLALLYWLQTEAEGAGGRRGTPGLRLAPEASLTDDGFMAEPYIRESRRLRAKTLVTELHVAEDLHPGKRVAPPFPDSVGVGYYRVDLHPSASGTPIIDFGALPFTVPLGAMVSESAPNLIPACKNLGVSHLANGCYRLHPIEWNIGEVAGELAAFCLAHRSEPIAVDDESLLSRFQSQLESAGIQLFWNESDFKS